MSDDNKFYGYNSPLGGTVPISSHIHASNSTSLPDDFTTVGLDVPSGIPVGLVPADNLEKLAEAEPNEDAIKTFNSLKELRAKLILEREIRLSGEELKLLLDGILMSLKQPVRSQTMSESIAGIREEQEDKYPEVQCSSSGQ